MSAIPSVEGGFRAAIIDPPWNFRSNSAARPGRNALRHYSCLTPAAIAALPIGERMAPVSMLAMWITAPHLAVGAHLPILKAWGFKPSTILTWVKLKPAIIDGDLYPAPFNDTLAIGTGLTFRACAEFVVVARRGRSTRKDAGVLGTFMAPRRRHSEKPGALHEMIERYTGGVGPFIELFARRSRPNWVTWGDQAGLFDSPIAEPSGPLPAPPTATRISDYTTSAYAHTRQHLAIVRRAGVGRACGARRGVTTVAERERIFRWCRWADVVDALALGWLVVDDCRDTHHGRYSVLVEWLCDCEPRWFAE